MKRMLIVLVAILFLHAPYAFAGLYSSGYSRDEGTVVAAVEIKEKGLYNLVATVEFLHRPQNSKIYNSNAYEKLIDRLLVESRGITLQILLDNNELSLSDFSGLKETIETDIENISNKLKKEFLPEQDVDVVFSVSDMFLLEPCDN
jgi:hypothetical protein